MLISIICICTVLLFWVCGASGKNTHHINILGDLPDFEKRTKAIAEFQIHKFKLKMAVSILEGRGASATEVYDAGYAFISDGRKDYSIIENWHVNPTKGIYEEMYEGIE